MSRPAKLIIHTNSFKHNLNVMKDMLGNTNIWACVKASAYGHGIKSIVRGLQDADGLAVLEIREAQEARRLGWKKPILLLEGIFSEEELEEINKTTPTLLPNSSSSSSLLSATPPGK